MVMLPDDAGFGLIACLEACNLDLCHNAVFHAHILDLGLQFAFGSLQHGLGIMIWIFGSRLGFGSQGMNANSTLVNDKSQVPPALLVNEQQQCHCQVPMQQRLLGASHVLASSCSPPCQDFCIMECSAGSKQCQNIWSQSNENASQNEQATLEPKMTWIRVAK